MPDRYELRNGGWEHWTLHRIDDDEEFGFDKKVGTYKRKAKAEAALKAIKAHPNMNFAEWFYGNDPFQDLGTIDQDWAARALYNRWKEIGGNLTVDKKRDLMNNIAAMIVTVALKYESCIEGINTGFAIELAGADR